MPKDVIKFNLRLSAKDGDLLLLAEQYHFSAMVLLAARRYLGKTEEQIPLPPKRPVGQRWFSITLRKEDDPDVYRLFKTLPAGYRGHAVKLMLRHAMERCDLRFMLEDLFQAESGPKTTARNTTTDGSGWRGSQEKPRVIKENGRRAFPQQKPGGQPERDNKKGKAQSEDTIFDLI